MVSKNNPKKIDNKYELIAFLFKYHIWKIIVVIISISLVISMFINFGYDKEKGIYWKPADISIKKGEK